MNGVKKNGSNRDDGLLASRFPTEKYGGTLFILFLWKDKGGEKCLKEVNQILGECYYSSSPEVVGYIEKMHLIWKEKGMLGAKEQRMLDQE